MDIRMILHVEYDWNPRGKPRGLILGYLTRETKGILITDNLDP